MSPKGLEVLKKLHHEAEIRVHYRPRTDALRFLLVRFEKLDEEGNALQLQHFNGNGSANVGETGDSLLVATISLDNVPTAYVERDRATVIELTEEGWWSIVRPLHDSKKASILGRAGVKGML